MDIVYTFDNGYSEITAVSLVSLLESNIECENLNLHIVDCGINEDNKENLRKLVKKYDRTIDFVPAVDISKRIPVALEAGYWSVVCYVRLFFAEMFPDLDRILHIDCDTIIRSNIEQVYITDIEEFACAACYDCLPSPKHSAGFKDNEKYFSNGFILFNLKLIREQKIEDKFINYIISKKGILPHLDQDVISATLKGMIFLLPPEYNMMSVTLALEEKCCDTFKDKGSYYSKTAISKAVEAPIIVHFVGYRYYSRPWAQPCYHPYNDEWINYYKKCSFNKDLPLLNKRKKKHGVLENFVLYLWNNVRKVSIIRNIQDKIELRRFSQ